MISNAYKQLAYQLNSYKAEVIQAKGDYLFIKADNTIKSNEYFEIVRHLKEYETTKKPIKKQKEKKLGQIIAY